MIDEEVRKLVEDTYLQAKTILTQHREQLVAMAETLLQKEVILKDEIEKILGKRSPTDTLVAIA